MAKLCPSCGNSYDDRNVFCPTDGSTLRTSGDGADIVGSVIADRYLITEKLGQGGMGRVYLAQHVRLPQQAAIKVLHPSLVYDTDALARFNHEASNACRINDTHVARVYDFGEAGTGLVYLAMEYVPGETLNELLRTGAPFAPLRAAALTRQIASGLDAAHKLGIVHRDLKPDNILVTRDTDGEELIKIVDFGIAKAIDTTTQNVTKTGFVLGTAQYMSPEQVSGRIIDRRSDVYALGLVAFMMLTGKLPFPAETAEEAMVKRLTEAPRTLAEMRDDIPWPIEVQQVFDGALAREIEGRYPTAGALGKALSRAIDAWQRPQAAAAPVAAAASRAPAVGASPRPASVGAVRGVGATASAAAGASDSGPRRSRWLVMSAGAIGLVAVVSVIGLTLANGSDSTGQSRVPPDSATSIPPAPPGLPDSAGRGTDVRSETTGTKSGTPRGLENRGEGPSRGGATGGRSPAPDTAGERAKRLAAARAASALAELNVIRARLHPDSIDLTRADDQLWARRAIDKLVNILPDIATAHDSLRAEQARANAHFFLEEIPTACAVLRSYLGRASTDARSSINGQIEMFNCPPA